MLKLFYFVLFLDQIFIILTVDFKRVCYLRPDLSFKIPIKTIIESNLCSHIIIGFASINDNSIVPNDLNDVMFYKECKSIIIESNSNTLLLLSIGGL